MRLYASLSLAALAAVVLASSITAEEQTLLSDLNNVSHGGFGGPVLRGTQFGGENGFIIGGRGGWIIDHRFIIGGAGYGIVSDSEPGPEAYQEYYSVIGPVKDPTSKDLMLFMGVGGLQLEYVIAPKKMVHASFGALFGGGGVGYTEINPDTRQATTDTTGTRIEIEQFTRSSSVYVIEPEINVTVNLTTNFRLSLTGSYRHVGGLDLEGVTTADVTGLSAGLTFRFGSF